MIMKKTKIIILSSISLLVALVTLLSIGKSEINLKDKVVFIDNTKVFENFQMKKDFDKVLERDLVTESQRLDSLGKVVTNLSENSASSVTVLEQEKQKYFSMKKIFEEKFSQLSKEYTAQVYERLNQYIHEFGKDKSFRMIVGANGQGNVMYVDKTADITADLITFCNKKYLDK